MYFQKQTNKNKQSADHHLFLVKVGDPVLELADLEGLEGCDLLLGLHAEALRVGPLLRQLVQLNHALLGDHHAVAPVGDTDQDYR